MRRLMLLLVVVLCLVVALGASGAAGSVPARWVITDLGTLGGESSVAVAINERGQVIGNAAFEATTEDGYTIVRAVRAFVWQDGRLRDLGVHLPGFLFNRAVAINERGQVLGVSERERDEGKGVTAARVWLWQVGQVRTILATSSAVGGLALNDRGQVVGSVGMGPDSAFSWENGKLTRIGGPGTTVSGLNNRGQVVGYRGSRAFLWQAGRTTDLGTLGGRISQAHAINDRGLVVGWSESRRTAQPGLASRSHAFVWEAGRMTDLGTFGGPISEAYAINDRGDVIGNADTRKQQSGGFVDHGFLWHDGTMIDINPPGLGLRVGEFDYGSGPVALNNHGQVVTYRFCCGGPQFGFVWESGATTKLGLLSAKGWSEPRDINDRGQIVGWATTKTSQHHAVLWTKRT